MKKFRTYWHSAFEIPQLRELLELVNKVYRQDELTAAEVEAVEDIISVVIDTGYEIRLRRDKSEDTQEKAILKRAISASINDRLFRKLWEDLKVARKDAVDRLIA